MQPSESQEKKPRLPTTSPYGICLLEWSAYLRQARSLWFSVTVAQWTDNSFPSIPRRQVLLSPLLYRWGHQGRQSLSSGLRSCAPAQGSHRSSSRGKCSSSLPGHGLITCSLAPSLPLQKSPYVVPPRGPPHTTGGSSEMSGRGLEC